MYSVGQEVRLSAKSRTVESASTMMEASVTGAMMDTIAAHHLSAQVRVRRIFSRAEKLGFFGERF